MKSLSCLNQERNVHRSSTVYKQKKKIQNSCKKICSWILMWEDNSVRCVSLDELLLWTGILASNGLKIKHLNDGFVSYKCSRVDYLWIIVMFLSAVWTVWSFWRHPFTSEDPSVSKWCKCYISPNLFRWRNKLKLGWPEGEYIYQLIFIFFGVKYSF